MAYAGRMTLVLLLEWKFQYEEIKSAPKLHMRKNLLLLKEKISGIKVFFDDSVPMDYGVFIFKVLASSLTYPLILVLFYVTRPIQFVISIFYLIYQKSILINALDVKLATRVNLHCKFN